MLTIDRDTGSPGIQPHSLTIPCTLRSAQHWATQYFTPLLILVAIVMVYIILGNESYIHPIAVLSILPSVGFGVLLMLKAGGFEFSHIAIIGIMLLDVLPARRHGVTHLTCIEAETISFLNSGFVQVGLQGCH